MARKADAVDRAWTALYRVMNAPRRTDAQIAHAVENVEKALRKKVLAAMRREFGAGTSPGVLEKSIWTATEERRRGHRDRAGNAILVITTEHGLPMSGYDMGFADEAWDRIGEAAAPYGYLDFINDAIYAIFPL